MTTLVKHISRFFICGILLMPAVAFGQALSLDSCRAMALRNNKNIQISRERLKAAEYKKKEAFAAYLPAIDVTASYLYNQKEISLLSEDQKLPTQTFNPATGKFEYNILKKPDGTPVLTPEGSPIPTQVAVIPKSALTYDVHNVFAGAVTLTQPIFMGGKIVAMNKMADLAYSAAENLLDNNEKEVIYAVDAAYWQVVSLSEKKKLADSYIQLLDTLNRNVRALMAEGMATRSDLLTVEVMQNEAEIDLSKVDNGIQLSRMALAQVCGMPLNSEYTLADECEDINADDVPMATFNIEDVYKNRTDVRSLQIAVDIFEQKQRIARADMMPSVALIGAYSLTNPNVFNGFDKSFKGMFSVGAMVKIPIWHWGGKYNKLRSAKSETAIKQLELAEAMEKVELQVNQAAFKARESVKTLRTATSSLDKAEENLRHAQIGYREGVMTVNNIMEAQTAWLKANSEHIDAMIDVKLCNLYLSKVKGIIAY